MNDYLVNYPVNIPPHSGTGIIRIYASRAMFYPYRLKEAAKKYGIGAPEAVSHLTLTFPVQMGDERT